MCHVPVWVLDSHRWVRSLHMHHFSRDLTRFATLIIFVQRGSSDSPRPPDFEVYLHWGIFKREATRMDWVIKADYYLDISYHLVRLTRWKMPSVGTWAMPQEIRGFKSLIGHLQVSDFLWGIRQAQDSEMTLVKNIDFESIGYHTVSRRMYLYQNWVSVLDDKLLRKGILQ